MPMKLNVGLSRKVGEPNYGSRGASVNLELELDAALVELSDASGLDRTQPQPHWYGLDPIHIRRRARPEAWQQFLAPLIEEFSPRHPGPLAQRRIWTRKAALRWRGGREFVTPQPCLTAGPTELWLF